MDKAVALPLLLLLLVPVVLASSIQLPARLMCTGSCSFSFDVVDSYGPRRWDCDWDGSVLTIYYSGLSFVHQVEPPLVVVLSVDSSGRYVMDVNGTKYYISEPGGQITFTCSGCEVEEWLEWTPSSGDGGGGVSVVGGISFVICVAHCSRSSTG